MLKIQPTMESALCLIASPGLKTVYEIKKVLQIVIQRLNWKYQRPSWNSK